MDRFEALKKGLEEIMVNDDDEFYKSYRTDLTDAMLDEYDWLTKNDFVQVEEYISFEIEDEAFSTNEFLNLTDLKHKIIKNLGKSEFDSFICMMLLALKYKILKIKDPSFESPIYVAGFTKEALNKYWEDTCRYMSEEDRKKIKTKFIEV